MATTESGRDALRLNAEAGELSVEGECGQAVILLEKALSLDPGNPLILYNLALALKASGERGRTEKILRSLTKPDLAGRAEDSLRSAAFTLLGLLKYEAGEPDAAERLYAEASALDPSNPDPWNDLGVLKFVSGSFAEAKANFEKAAGFNPASEDILVNLRDVNEELARSAEGSQGGEEEPG